MFLASKLVYALKFYPLHERFQNQVQNSIFNYFNFPQKGQKETWKGKYVVGCKLANIQIKSQTSKSKWLMNIISNPVLKLNYSIFEELLGTQKGNATARDLLFMDKSCMKKMQICPFYKEALMTTWTGCHI